MRERPYAITIMDKQGRVYFLTEELMPDIWSKKDGSKKSNSKVRFFFRKRTEDVCLHNIKLFQTTELARNFWWNCKRKLSVCYNMSSPLSFDLFLDLFFNVVIHGFSYVH